MPYVQQYQAQKTSVEDFLKIEDIYTIGVDDPRFLDMLNKILLSSKKSDYSENHELTRKFTLGPVKFPINQSFLDERIRSLGLILGKVSTLNNIDGYEQYYLEKFFTAILFEHQAASCMNQKKYSEAKEFYDKMLTKCLRLPCCYYYCDIDEDYSNVRDIHKLRDACTWMQYSKKGGLTHKFTVDLGMYNSYIKEDKSLPPIERTSYTSVLPETRRMDEVVRSVVDLLYKSQYNAAPKYCELCSLPESLKTLKESTENLERLSMDYSRLDSLLSRIFELSKVKNEVGQEDKLNEYNSLVRQFVLGPIVFPTDQSILNRRMELLHHVGSRILTCTNPEAKDYLTRLFNLIFWEHQAASYANQKEYAKAKELYDAVFKYSKGFYDDYCKKSSDFNNCNSWIDASSEACKILQSKKLKGDSYILNHYLTDVTKLSSSSYRKYFSEISELEKSFAEELKQSGVVSGFDDEKCVKLFTDSDGWEYYDWDDDDFKPQKACKRGNSDEDSRSVRQHTEEDSMC